MSSVSSKPLLLIDVDGVISLFGFDPAHAPAGRFEMVDGIAHFLSASAGQHLRQLAPEFELVWCSGWEEKANEYLPRALGMPASLPYLSFGRAGAVAGGHWKLDAIDCFVGVGRPLAWIDDDHDDACADWAAARAAPTLLITTDPAVGLTDEHVGALVAWARDSVEEAQSNEPWRPAPARKRSSPA
jgi:hypothetical protein